MNKVLQWKRLINQILKIVVTSKLRLGNFTSTSTADISIKSKTISVGKDTTKIQPLARHVSTTETSALTNDSVTKGQRGFPPTSISDMTTLLLQNRVSSQAMVWILVLEESMSH